MNDLRCPRCGLSHTKKNGHTHYRKQNYRRLSCGRQSVREAQRVGTDTGAVVKRLLPERLSSRGIRRVAGVSLTWLLQFIAAPYERLPDDLYVVPASPERRVRLPRLGAEVDGPWGFVRSRADKQWPWLASDTETRQVIAFFVGDRSRESARRLWQRTPAVYRGRATSHSDDREAYKGVIPPARRVACGKGSGLTSGVERSDRTSRQRSRGWCARRSRPQRSWRTISRPLSISSVTTTERRSALPDQHHFSALPFFLPAPWAL
jgi:insertion element IS1 protein InsB